MNCSDCISYAKKNRKSGVSVLGAILIALIPKCGLCVMAYSSAIAMCGGTHIYMAENDWVSYIPIVLSALIIFLILKNQRGVRTAVATMLALLGFAFILGAHQTWLTGFYYDFGNFLMFMAIWINSSFISVIRNIQNWFTKKLSWSK